MRDQTIDKPIVKVEAAIVCRRSSCIDDWFLIERADHDGSTWELPINVHGIPGSRFHTAARLVSDTDIEGTAYELRYVAAMIKARRDADTRFVRIAVRRVEGGFLLWSPRNSRSYAHVSDEIADALAASVDAVVRGSEER